MYGSHAASLMGWFLRCEWTCTASSALTPDMAAFGTSGGELQCYANNMEEVSQKPVLER